MKKGMSGIGVLIIFIAMILVAAVAAMVLLQTVGSLEGQALQTGKQSTGEVSTKVRITGVTGITNNATTPYSLEYIRIVARLAPGSSEINLDNMLMTFAASNLHAAGLFYNMSAANTVVSAQAATRLNATYSVVYLGQDAGLAAAQRGAIKQNDIIEIWYRAGVQLSALTTNISGGIMPSTSATISLTPTQGATESIPFRTPPSYDGTYVKLFP